MNEIRKKTSIKMNYFYSMIFQVLNMTLPLFTAPYIARVIGAEGIGIYSYSASVAQYFMYFALLGINVYGNRSIARIQNSFDKRSTVFSEIYYLQFILSFFVTIVYTIYSIREVGLRHDIAVIQILLVASVFFDVSWLYFGMEDFKTTVTRQVFIKVFTFLMIFVVIKKESDLWKYALILAGANFLGQLYLFISLKKYVIFKKVYIKDIVKHVKPVLILFIPIIATSVYRVMDKVMIGQLSNMYQVGYYENADKLVATVLGVIGSLGSVMLPRMSNIVALGKKALEKKYILKSMEITMWISSAITFGIMSVAKEFIPIFYGEGFEECVVVLIELSVSALFISWANVIRMQHIIPNGKDKIYVLSVVAGAIVNVIINFILIPKWGAKGAAIGTIIAEALVMFIQTFLARKDLEISKFIKSTIPHIIFGAVMWAALSLIGKNVNNNVIVFVVKVIVGGLIYLSLSVGYFIFTKNEIISNLLKHKK